MMVFILLKVKLANVSPGENYLVTYNSQTPNIPHDATVSAPFDFFFIVSLWM